MSKDKLRKLIREMVMNEIDWEDDFSDVLKQCISPEKMVEYLNSLIKRQQTPAKEREKRDLSQPVLHPSTVTTTEEGDVDLDAFIKKITATPKQIIGVNDKMEKSASGNQVVVKTGVPALKGIVYDMENGKFYFVNTCPGAKECIIGCYALAGNFIRVEGPILSSTRVLNLLMNNPKKYARMLYADLASVAARNDAMEDGKNQIVVRFNDSGDFFSKKYLEIVKEVTNQLVEDGYNVKPYAYTKMADVANQTEDDFTFNFSQGANKKETEKFKGGKQSVIVKRDLFKDLFTPIAGKHFKKDEEGRWEFKDASGMEELKKRIASEYNIDINDLLSYSEYMRDGIKDGEIKDVIVMPGDGDNSAWDKNVRTTYLLEH